MVIRILDSPQFMFYLLQVGVYEGDGYYFERSRYVFYNKTGGVVDVGKYAVIWTTTPSLLLYIDCANSDGQH